MGATERAHHYRGDLRTTALPSGEYLVAFVRRFAKTWRSRSEVSSRIRRNSGSR